MLKQESSMKRFQAKYKLKNSSNISEIWKNRDKYLSAYSNPIGSPLRKTLKSTKLNDDSSHELKTELRTVTAYLEYIKLYALQRKD